MGGKLAAFVALAVLFAAVFVRLGIWQLDRMAERQAFNAGRATQMAIPAVAFDSVGDASVNRRVVIEGVLDYDHEFVLAGRSRNGSPGVHLFTPIRRAGRDTAVLVNRGWVYAPDAATVDLSRFREQRERLSGHTETIPADVPASPSSKARTLRRLSATGVAALLPYPVSSIYVVSQDSAGQASPVRLPPPALDDGPHLSYAIQWFCFALIAVGGAAVVVYRARQARGDGATAA